LDAAQQNSTSLKRSLAVGHLLIYGLVMVGPTAPFAVFGIVFNTSRGMVPLVYLVGLVAMLFTARSYMTMARLHPVAGSAFTYASRSIGPTAGFLTGWALLLDYLLAPALCNIAAIIALKALMPWLPFAGLVFAFVAIATIVNLLGIESTARASLALLALQLIVLVAFVGAALLGMARGTGGAHLSFAPLFNAAEFQPRLILGAASLAMLSFLGFDAISTMVEEAKRGATAISQATILTLCVVGALFALQTWLASCFALDRTAFPAGPATDGAFYDIAYLVGGSWLKFLATIPGVLIGALASGLGSQAATARLILGMAREGKLPRTLAHLHPVRRVPDHATLLVGAATLVLGLAIQDLELLTSIVCFGALIGFLMVNASVIAHVLRAPGKIAWLRLISPVLGALVTLSLLWNTTGAAKATGLGWLALGLVALVVGRFRGVSEPAPQLEP
jgi:amino acid transporter